MKKNKLLFGALALLAFTACSDDKFSDAPAEVLNDGSESYITVRIMDATSVYGRAAEFENGNTITDGTNIYNENAIESLTIAFYDANMKFITFGTAGKADITTTPSSGNIETLGEAKVKLTLRADQSIPRYAIAFANPIRNQPGLSNIETTQISFRDRFWTSVSPEEGSEDKNTKYLFAMNNSVYFSGEEEAANHELQVAVPVTEKNFYKGKNADNAEAVDFYIERIASKVILKSTTDNNTIPVENIETKIEGLKDNDGKIDESKKLLVFVPEKWAINAEEKGTNLMKHFMEPYNTLSSNLTWGTGVLWNDPTNHRSYWTHSLNFSTDLSKFPDVSDDVVPATTPLTYHSYKEIMASGSTVGKALYTFENTRQSSSFAKNSAVASAVIIGHYEIRENGSTKTTPVTFFRRNGSIFTIDGFWAAMASSQQLIVKKTETTETSITYQGLSATELAAIAKYDHPTETPLQDKVVENQVTVMLKEGASLNDYYIKDSDGKYKPYSEVKDTWTNTKINEYLLQVCGLTEIYNDGKAYFNIPIRHLGQMDGKTKGAGYYGVVRNHTYEITVDKIANTAMATGIFNDEEEIVPPTTNDEYNLKANFKVLAWRIVTQNVTLGE